MNQNINQIESCLWDAVEVSTRTWHENKPSNSMQQTTLMHHLGETGKTMGITHSVIEGTVKGRNFVNLGSDFARSSRR